MKLTKQAWLNGKRAGYREAVSDLDILKKAEKSINRLKKLLK